MTTSLGLVDAFEKAAQIRRNRSRGLRDLSQFSPVAANRDAAAGAKMSTAASTREAVPPGAPTVAYTPGATRPEPSTRQWTPTPSVRVTRDTRAEGSSSEPVCIGLGQMSRAEGDTARDAVPAPPGRAAGVHVDRDGHALRAAQLRRPPQGVVRVTARSQSTVRVGCPETPARTVQLSSVAPERVSEPTHTRLGDTATLAPATHKERGSAGYPTGRRVTLGGAPCACVANAPAAQLPSSSEPSCERLGQLSRAEGDTARDSVPAPPGRGAGAHGFDLRGSQHQGVGSC